MLKGLAVAIFSWLLLLSGLGAQTPRHYEASSNLSISIPFLNGMPMQSLGCSVTGASTPSPAGRPWFIRSMTLHLRTTLPTILMPNGT